MAEIGVVAIAVGALAVSLELVFAWPQAVDALRSPDVSGISPATTVLMVLTAVSWLAYGVAAADPIVIVANAVMLAATTVIATALARRGGLPGRVALAIGVLWAAAIAVAWTATGATGLGVVGAALGISMGIPQAAHAALRGTVAGVAISSYVMLAALQAAWLVYGVLVADAVIVIPNVIALPVSLGVVTVLLARQPADQPVELTALDWALSTESLEN